MRRGIFEDIRTSKHSFILWSPETLPESLGETFREYKFIFRMQFDAFSMTNIFLYVLC